MRLGNLAEVNPNPLRREFARTPRVPIVQPPGLDLLPTMAFMGTAQGQREVREHFYAAVSKQVHPQMTALGSVRNISGIGQAHGREAHVLYEHDPAE